MNMATKQDIFHEHLVAYGTGSRAEKGAILEAACRITGMHRKAVTRRFRLLMKRDPAWIDRRGGIERYGPDVTAALKDLWTLAGEICAERFHQKIPEYIRQSERVQSWGHSQSATQRLREMSLGTMKDRIACFDHSGGRRGGGTTKPSGIKEIVPVRRGPWNAPPPGFGEVDTVAHCGETTAGDFAYTVQYTDVATIWTCLCAQWNKGEAATLRSIQRIEQRLPFPLHGLDPDSGGEFINWHLVDWAAQHEPPIILTRTRPYRKNDHARIEQKNYVNIRKWVGYVRLDDVRSVSLLQKLYIALEDYLNFFIPSMVCIAKERTPHQRTKRIYDTPATAYERVLARKDVTEDIKQRLREKYARLSMVGLKEQIDRLTNKLTTYSKRLR